MPRVRIQRKWEWNRGIGQSLVPGQNRPRTDLDDLGHLNDSVPAGDFMAVTSIVPVDNIISTSTAFEVGSVLLEAGIYQLYAYAGPIQSTTLLTIRAKNLAGLILATVSNAAEPTLMGPSAQFTLASTQYIVFDAAMASVGATAIIKAISIYRQS